LPENEQRFVFDGLAILAANVLLNNARTIKRLTRMGALKMLKNIQAIQQSLSSVSLMHEQRLDKARQYYQLFLQSGEEIIQSIEDNGAAFSYEEYLTLFKLKYQHELTIPEHPLIQVYETCCAQLKKLCPK
jgi:exocyst complex component 4